MKAKFFSIVTIALALFCTTASAQFKINTGKQSPLQKLQWAEVAITNLYVDSVKEEKLVEDAIRGMLEKLDPHSTYSTPEEVKELNEPLQGNFDGIGVQFNMVEDTLMVIQTINDGPSEKVGILPGDRIISVNDTAIAGVKMDKNKIMKKLRGPRGTKVNVGVIRRGIDGVLNFTITRAKIPVKTIDAYYMIRPGIGYIRIGSFGATTYKEFLEALMDMSQTKDGKHKLLKDQFKTIIIDLQDNGGGYLNTAVNLAEMFLEKDDLIVYTEGRAQKRQDFKASKTGELAKTKVIVLTNEYSASASEILSGAIQDHDRGTIVGRRTFGKGLVQRPVALPDESMIRLTVAHYYTPSGRCIQKPYTKGDKKSYEKDLMDRYNNGEFTNADSIHFNDSLKYETLKKHRIVYGGGGIMADHFVPLDTTKLSPNHRPLIARGIVNKFVLEYFRENQKQLQKQYNTFEEFNEGFEVTDKMIDQLYAKASADSIKLDSTDVLYNNALLKMQCKANIASDLYETGSFARIMNKNNKIFCAGLDIITNEEKYYKILKNEKMK